MLEIALTGNRFTGKDYVAAKFRNLGIPVFDADVVLKFIINQRFYFHETLKKELGKNPFFNGFINPGMIRDDKEFDIVINQVEEELFLSYDRFRKHETYPYCVFLSSLLYERKWNEKFDIIINTFAPNDDRAFRAKCEYGITYVEFFNAIKTEFSQYKKNEMANHVLHSYNGGFLLEESIIKIDETIKEKIKKLYSYASRG